MVRPASFPSGLVPGQMFVDQPDRHPTCGGDNEDENEGDQTERAPAAERSADRSATISSGATRSDAGRSTEPAAMGGRADSERRSREQRPLVAGPGDEVGRAVRQVVARERPRDRGMAVECAGVQEGVDDVALPAGQAGEGDLAV
jgi:hypothetical protein